MRTIALILMLCSLVEARPQRPVNGPRPAATTAPATGGQVAGRFYTGELVSKYGTQLSVSASGKNQVFTISERSQIPDSIKEGDSVMVHYTVTPQGWEVVKVVPKPKTPQQ